MIVASIVQDGNFNNLLTEGNDVALLAERVSESFHSQCVNILTILAIIICRLFKRIWNLMEEHLELVEVMMVKVCMYLY